MDLINEYEKEIKELKKQKESIEKLSEQSANLKVERDKKKQELDKIQDYKSAFYEDLSKEYSEKDSEFATSLAHEELAKRNLKRNLEEKKSEILNGLETKLVKVEENRNNEFAKMEQDEVKKLTEEKKKLEEELKLNDVTKEEWLKLPREEQIKVNHAKEQYLNNKHRLQEIEPKLEIANIYEGKTPIEKYTEIKEKIDVINKEFTLENLDNLVEKLNQKESKENLEKDWEEAIKENEEFDKRKAIRKDLDERTEKAIAKNQNKNSEQLNNNEAQPNQPQQSNDNTPFPATASIISPANFSAIVFSCLFLAYVTNHLNPKVCLLSGLISNGTWYVAPPTLLALTSRTGIMFSKAASKTSKGFFPSFSFIMSNASYTIF